MADITDLILQDHTWFRTQFFALDLLYGREAPDQDLRRVWGPLATHLDLHANAEEQLFYPQLLRRGQDDPEEETLDAIGDHNAIRDGVRDAALETVGSAAWWAAVGRTNEANSDHMAEEERQGLSDFRRHAPAAFREELGRRFAEYFVRHTTTAGIDISDKDPGRYVENIEAMIRAAGPDPSLGIGSLKGR